MSSIELLDQNTIDKIAAGEVVERPASIVKELVENAIDAGATAINVEIKDGGISFIRITDNGCGIPKDQVRKAFLRHSTSKIRQVEDLQSISSLGFRGEALSSISAISQVELITKVSGALTGVRYIIEGGSEHSFDEIGAPEGTTFIVRNVFYNTPARKKFLKTPTTEGGYIASLMERLSLSHPDISFNFIQNGKTRLHTTGNGSLKDIAYNIFGREISDNLVAVNSESDGVKITGFICKPVVSRGNRNYENYFVNGRFVRNNIISRAIEDGFKPYMMQHRYPFTLMMFDIPGDTVDVNVHPAKQEVRFDKGDLIYSAVYNTVLDSLSGKNLIPEISFDEEEKEAPKEVAWQRPAEPFEVKRHEAEQNTPLTSVNFIREEVSYGASEKEESPAPDLFRKETAFTGTQMTFPEIEEQEKASPSINLIGQVFDTYWIIQYEDKMYIVDQHAAHEKVKYERTLKSLKNKEFTSQMISPAVVISLNDIEAEVLNNNLEQFTSLGFEISSFGGREYLISAIPDNVFGLDFKDLFIELLDNLTDGSVIQPDILLHKIATMSCKAAVKGNNSMSFAEAKELIKEMFTLDNPFNCPHGRPTVISMSKYELEKKFKRII